MIAPITLPMQYALFSDTLLSMEAIDYAICLNQFWITISTDILARTGRPVNAIRRNRPSNQSSILNPHRRHKYFAVFDIRHLACDAKCVTQSNMVGG
jgi:hypothetical protein